MSQGPKMSKHYRNTGLAALLLLSLGSTWAQTDAKPSREREQLRRSQAALQAAQSRADGLEAEKAACLREKDDAGKKEQQSQRAAARRLQAQAEQAQGEVQRLREDLALAIKGRQQSEAALVESEGKLQQTLAQARRNEAELRAGNGALAALLELKTQALTAAEARNRELYSLGVQFLDQWLNKTVAEATVQQEPVLGLVKVGMQERAERMRASLDAQRPASAPLGGQ
jgi:chromosome segregation ATPase